MKKTLREITDLEVISFHEAGHAVLEYLLGYSIIHIVVDPSEAGGSCSDDHISDARFCIAELRSIPEFGKQVLIYCGGYAAESILIYSKIRWRSSPDYHHAVKALLPVYKDKKVIANYIESMRRWAKALLQEYWWVVEALADALIWHSEETHNEDWYGSDMEDELPTDFYKSEACLRVMQGLEAEEVISRVLIQNWGADRS
jgi:hypothetical protein